MKRHWQYGAWIFAALALSFGGAQSKDATNRSDPRGDDRKLVVQVGDKMLASPQPAILNVSFDAATSEGMAELSWEVDDGTSLVMRVPYAELRVGHFDAELVSGPLVTDRATANLRVEGSLVRQGRMSFTLSKGRIAGGTEAESLRFDGVLAVSCSVPEAALAAEPGTAKADAAPAAAPIPVDARAPQVLIDDLRFRSPQCARVKADFR